MAIYKPVITTGAGLELFTSSDIYRYDVDNRPLNHLAANDIAIKDAVDELVDEIEDAYVGVQWPAGSAYTWGTLDSRLDNMDIFLQELFDIRNVQFSAFQQSAAFLRERYTSGFMNGPYPDKFIRSNFAMENNEFMPSPFGGFFVPERAWTVKNQNVPDEETKNCLAIETRIEQDGMSRKANTKPIYVLVNGFVVPVLNCHGGTYDASQSADKKLAFGNWGQITINFPPAPTTGHRFDLAFLEVWLQEVDANDPRFYPYGSRDFGIWGRATLAAGDDATESFNGQVVGRDIVKYTELKNLWGFSVYLRATGAGDIDYDSETPVCMDNGSGVLTEVSGSGWSGTIDYDTGEWTLTAPGGSPPTSSQELVVAYRYQAITDPDDVRLQGTISFLGSGNYIQVQHRLRVAPDVDYANYPRWMDDDTNVEARGPNSSPVSGYAFSNGLNDFHDGTLWFSGAGDTTSKTDLGTYDGYIYAIPLCVWSRFNTTAWAYDNQNGGTDRPDGLSHDVPDDRHVIDLRPVVFSERYGMNEAAENTLDRIIRGDHRSIFGQPIINSGDNSDADVFIEVWGVETPEIWRVYQYSGLAINTNIATVRDIGLSTSSDPSDGAAYTAPVAHHDGIRRLFSPQEEVQEVPVSITDVTASTACNPSPLISYNNSTKVITLATTDTQLSGYSATSGKGAIINDSYPRLWWRGSRQPVIFSSVWSGLGTNTATATIDTSAATYEPNGTIDGIVEVLYPECTGIARPLKYCDHVLFHDGVNDYATAVAGNEDGSPDDPDMVLWKISESLEPGYNLPSGMCIDPTNTYIYVCDSANNRVARIVAATLEYDAQWPTPANYDDTPWDASKHLRYPVDVACDSSGNVYVADRDSHRVVKLNAGLTALVASFGTANTPANTATHTTRLYNPEGVTVDSSGNVFIADTGLYRLVKLNSSLTYVSQIGDGTSGSSKEQFIQPMGLDVGSVGGDEYVYVADESRIVLVDPTQMSIESILGSMMGADMQQFYRDDWVAIEEDANENKYCVAADRKQILKFNKGFQLVATFGEDGVSGFDSSHLNNPRDVVYDPDAALVYVADYTQPGPATEGRVVVLDAADLSYVGAYDTEPVTGMALFPDSGTSAKLYLAGQNHLRKIALPTAASRGTTASWSEDWDVTAVGGHTFTFCHDVEVNAAGNVIYVGDFLTGKVLKVDPTPGTPTLTATADLVTQSKTSAYPAAVGVTAPWGMALDDTESHLYVCGGSLDGNSTAGFIRDIDTSTMVAAANDLYDPQNWPSGSWPANIRFANNGNAYVLLADVTSMQVYEQPFTPVSGKISTNFLYDTADLPLDIDLDLAVEWENVRAVHLKDDILYVADVTTNTLTAIDATSLTVLGQIGSPAVVGRGKASMAGPGGVVVYDDELWFADTYNNRVVRGYRYFPNVERGTGRISYLIAPPATITCTYQARFAPYQGCWRFINESGVYGRHYVSDTNMIYISTLGRGTPTTVTQDGGMGFYANMLAHLPTPIDSPNKSPRVTDEYLFAPEPLPITGETGGTPYARLPVINRYPASAQEINPYYGGGSRFDFNRVFFIQGPGRAISTEWGDNVPLDYSQRGFEATGTFPGFDTLETFPLKTISVPRVIFSTAIVEIDGEGYLVIFSSYRAEERNRLNDGTPIAADLFKLFGNPGIRTRY
jgi:sugar lactone lactonase YvrE